MNTLTRYIIGAVIACVIAFLVWFFSDIVAYILISAVLAIIGKPLIRVLMSVKLRGHFMPRWSAALLTLITIWVCVLTFVTIFFPLIFEKLNEISMVDISHFVQSLNEPLARLQTFLHEELGFNSDQLPLKESLTAQLSEFLNLNSLNNLFGSFFSIVGNTFVSLFSISFITFFFLKEDNLFYNMMLALLPAKYEDNLTRALDSITELLIRYFTGIVAESCIMMLLVSIGLIIWGAEAQNAFFIGFIVGILNVIPYVGPLIGAVIGICFGVINPIGTFSILATGFIIAGTIITAQLIDNIVIQPVLYSNRVKAHPLEIFIVLLIAGSVAGVLGMLLAIPSYTVLRVFAKEFFYNFRLVQKLTEKI